MAAPEIRFLIKADGAPEAIKALREIRAEEKKLADEEQSAAKARKSAASDASWGTFKGQFSQIASMAKIALPAFSFYEITKGFASSVEGAAKMAAGIGRVRKETGMSLESLSTWNLAAMKMGKTMDDVSPSLAKMSSFIGGYKLGGAKETQGIAQIFGGNADALKGMSDDQAMEKLIKQLNLMGPSMERTNWARANLGRGMSEMLPIIDKVGGNFADLKKEAEETGLIVDSKLAASMARSKEAMREMEMRSKGLAMQFASGLYPAIGDISHAFAEMSKNSAGATEAMHGFGYGIGVIAKGIAGVVFTIFDTLALGITIALASIVNMAHRTFTIVKSIATPGRGWLDGVKKAWSGSIENDVFDLQAIQDNFFKDQGKLWKNLFGDEPKKAGEKAGVDFGKSFIQRRDAILKEFTKKGWLTEDLKEEINSAKTGQELEVIYTRITEMHKGDKKAVAAVNDWAEEIARARKDAALAQIETEKLVQEELFKIHEEEAKREYEIGTLSIDEYFRGRRDALQKKQAAESASFSQRYNEIIGLPDGKSMPGDQTLIAATQAMALLKSGTDTGENEVRRLTKIKDLDALIRGIELERLRIEQERKKLGIEDATAKYNAAAKKMQEDLDRVNAAKQAQMDKLSAGKQDTFTTDANIANIQLRNMLTLRADLQAMSDAAVTDEQRAAVQAMTTAFKDWGVAINTTKVAMDQFKLSIGDLMVSGITEFLMNFATQQKSIGQAALDMAQSFVQSVLQMITQALVMKVIFSAMDLPIPGGSLASAIGFSGGGSVQKKADGGAIFGAGTGTSDSIPALLSNGEHVWTAAEVRAAGGHGAVYAMRSAIRTGSRYAEGGSIGDASGAALNVSGSSSAMLNVGLDRGLVAELVDEHISGPGMKTIIKGTSRNAKAMKTAMGG